MVMSKIYCCIFLLIGLVIAQEKEQEDNKTATDKTVSSKNNYIGITMGSSTGFGFTYRRKLGEHYAGQLSYLRVKSSLFSVAVTGFRYLKRTKYADYIGYSSLKYGNKQYLRGKDHFFTWGTGIGFDFHFWDVTLNLMCGVAPYVTSNGDKITHYGVTFSPESGIYVRF